MTQRPPSPATTAAMRKCRSGNATELSFRAALAGALGPRVRFEAADLPGTPDAVCDDARVCLFLHGCFWHGCPVHYRPPRRNAAYWRDKVERNRARDQEVVRELGARGWTVLVVWEHELRGKGVGRVVAWVRSVLAGNPHRG